MKKKLLGLLLGVTITGAMLGGAVYSYANGSGEVKLQIAGQEDTQEEADDEAAADEEDTDWNLAGIEATQMVSSDSQEFSYSNVADVAEAVMPAIVSITNSSVQEVNDWFSRRSYQYESESAGSGIIVGSNETELLICTNNHVVEGANTLTVTFIDEESYEAKIKGTSADDDLAVIAVALDDISKETKEQIMIAQTGDSDEMRVGEQVVAIGNALGYGQSVTTGIISAKDRMIQVQEGMDVYTYENLIQTDAAINPGNSGGALLNMNGEVIGINSAKASSSGVEGMGYSIPISKAMPILEKLMSRETRSKVDESEASYIGITGEGVSSEATQLYGIPEGIYLISVGEGSPAEEAGLQESDIITEFDGISVTSMSDLRELLLYYAAGETVEMTVQSNENGAYTEKTVEITLGSREDSQY